MGQRKDAHFLALRTQRIELMQRQVQFAQLLGELEPMLRKIKR